MTWTHGFLGNIWVPGYLLAITGAEVTIPQLVALQVHNVFGLVRVPTALTDDQGLVQEEAIPGDRGWHWVPKATVNLGVFPPLPWSGPCSVPPAL